MNTKNMPGGFTEALPADNDIQKIVDDVRSQMVKFGGKPDEYGELKAHSYKSQVVAGTNFRIKVNAGGQRYLHMRIFRPLPCYGSQLELTGVEFDKKLEDKLD